MPDTQSHQQPQTLLWLPCAALLLLFSGAAVYMPLQSLAQGGPDAVTWQRVLLSDAVFTAGALLFLAGGLHYGRRQHPLAAAYQGAWLNADGQQVVPAGFATYLPLAGVLAFLLPVVAAALLAARGSGTAAGVLLGGYLAAFFAQMLLETRFFHRNPLSPAVPFVFAPYRFWQLSRSLWLLCTARQAAAAAGSSIGGSGSGGGGGSLLLASGLAAAPSWMAPFLTFLLGFWALDYGVTAVQLPWVFNWQLQGGAVPSAHPPAAGAAGPPAPAGQPPAGMKKDA